jgi:hypothetical protein
VELHRYSSNKGLSNIPAGLGLEKQKQQTLLQNTVLIHFHYRTAKPNVSFQGARQTDFMKADGWND